MATKHMNAAPGDFAETVLMPGDPLRARYIAENWFDAPRRVTDVRNMWGFTGTWRGRILEDTVFNPAEVTRLGLLLADKKAGPFKLEVDWIKVTKAE